MPALRVPKDQLTNIKNKKGERLLSVDQELRVCFFLLFLPALNNCAEVNKPMFHTKLQQQCNIIDIAF